MTLVLWTLPVVGLILGYLYAFVTFHGSLETWHFIGQPDQKITRILGIRDNRTLIVATETGRVYSVAFMDGEEVTLSRRSAWQNEELDTVDPVHPLEYYGADFYPLRPLFRVKQLYETAYIYNYEGKGEVKFALAADGNLWMWKHRISGLTGLVFRFFPVLGFIAGLLIALTVTGFRWLRRRSRLLVRQAEGSVHRPAPQEHPNRTPARGGTGLRSR